VSGALSFNTLVSAVSSLVASLHRATVSRYDAFVYDTGVFLAKTLAILAFLVAVVKASLMADAVDGLAEVLSWVFLAGSGAEEVARAVSVGSAFSLLAVVVDADRLGAALVVLVASNSVTDVWR